MTTRSGIKFFDDMIKVNYNLNCIEISPLRISDTYSDIGIQQVPCSVKTKIMIGDFTTQRIKLCSLSHPLDNHDDYYKNNNNNLF